MNEVIYPTAAERELQRALAPETTDAEKRRILADYIAAMSADVDNSGTFPTPADTPDGMPAAWQALTADVRDAKRAAFIEADRQHRHDSPADRADALIDALING